MEIVFLCLQNGRKFYSVRLNGQEIFVGTQGECDRFLEIHNRKVDEERVEHSRTPRARPYTVRTYRQARAQA
jgi:hypothetical protein